MHRSGNKVMEILCHVHRTHSCAQDRDQMTQWTQRVDPGTLVLKLMVLACLASTH
jgi:hypothetical protein